MDAGKIISGPESSEIKFLAPCIPDDVYKVMEDFQREQIDILCEVSKELLGKN